MVIMKSLSNKASYSRELISTSNGIQTQPLMI